MDSPQQLDLFAHSALDQVLRAFVSALVRGDVQLAIDNLARLRDTPGVNGALLRDCGMLLQPLLDADVLLRDPQAGLRYLWEQLAPLAQRRLGSVAGETYRRLLLARLATAMDGRGHVTGRDAVHPAELWLQIEQPQRARDSVCADLFWRGCPLRLALHARICERLHEPVAALRDWIGYCLLAPSDIDQALSHSALLGADWADYLDLDPGLQPQWFPAWLELSGRQSLPATLQLDDSSPAAGLLKLLLQTPRAARGAIEFRSTLQRTCPALLAHWLAARRG